MFVSIMAMTDLRNFDGRMVRRGRRDRLPWRALLPAAGLLTFLIFGFAGALLAQAQNGITQPAAGDVVSGVVIVQGTATDPNFLRYELAFNRGADWIVFAEGDQPVINGTLAIWDTTVGSAASPVFPDGAYQLRLRVVRTDFNYDEYFVSNVIVANAGAVTETPTPTETGTPGADEEEEPAGTPTLIPSPAAQPGPLPTVLPSLTPFPTPSPPATPQGADNSDGGVRPGVPDAGDGQGLLGRLLSIDTSRFGRAFWQGVTVVFYLFMALGLYLLLRSVGRWLWRQLRRGL